MNASDAIPFEKYHGLGNDYLVLDGRDGLLPGADVVRRICDRNRGVGSDGILLRVRAPAREGAALRIFNPDGSEAEKSGNGLRIFARYLFDRGEVADDAFPVHTAGGDVRCRVLDRGRRVRVEMGRASFDSRVIPVAGPPREVLRESLEVDGVRLEFSAVSVGNPHCVIFRDPLSADEILRFGPRIERDARFPNRTNVQLVQVVDRDTLAIEIWERGAGHTLASGSSSCAAAAVARRLGLCGPRVEVGMRGGALRVEIGEGFELVQEGPVVHVASGSISGEALEETRAFQGV